MDSGVADATGLERTELAIDALKEATIEAGAALGAGLNALLAAWVTTASDCS
ncbi:MAG: hypothetical protein H6744_14685 [Deltaproteobacteria bacterium]|nr:hypothetical protein [Deltaproteobacteria bacterium]